MSSLEVVVLAAGQGTRMKSGLPKVLHHLAEKPMLRWVTDVAESLDPARVHVVYGHGGDEVRTAFIDTDFNWVEQAEQLGTGHAVRQAIDQVDRDSVCLVLYGDVPLVNAELLESLVAHAREGALGVITAQLANPFGYGRIVRDDDSRVRCIVEEKDATAAQRTIQEINSGLMAAPAGQLNDWLSRINQRNAQAEYYLTDIVALAAEDGVPVRTELAATIEEISGVNDRLQLAELERHIQRRRAEALMRDGVTLRDPNRLDIRGQVTMGRDIEIDVNVVLEGVVEIEDGVAIGANCVIKNARIAAHTVIHPNCHIEGASVGMGAKIGPFARLRPGAELAESVHVGNFVEVKKSTLGPRSKANHLTYVGDSHVGADVNIGAGTITCNYDGVNKHQTVIGDGAFIGSGVELIAPVKVEAGATIGAGSTITKTAPADRLTLERAKQMTINSWRRPTKISK